MKNPEYFYCDLNRKNTCQVVHECPNLLIFENKKIDNFRIGPWMSEKSIVKIMLLWKSTQKQIPDHLKSEIRKIYSLQKVKEAIRDYSSQMTAGNFLLKMSLKNRSENGLSYQFKKHQY